MCDFTSNTPSNDDIEDVAAMQRLTQPKDLEDIAPTAFMPNPPKAKLILKDIIKMDPIKYNDTEGFNSCLRITAKKYKYQSTKRELGMIYRQMLKKGPYQLSLHREPLECPHQQERPL